MKTIAVSTRSKEINGLLKKARNANLLLRSVEGEQYVLAKISGIEAFYVGNDRDFAEEIKKTRANKKMMKFLDKRAARAKKQRGIPLEEVEAQLGLK